MILTLVILKESLFSDDTIENETKPVDAKKIAVQDAGYAVKEENVKCDYDSLLHIITASKYVAFALITIHDHQ